MRGAHRCTHNEVQGHSLVSIFLILVTVYMDAVHSMMEKDSWERALGDAELVAAAYPDEVSLVSSASFPLLLNLHLSETSYVRLQMDQGYPITTNIQIVLYRSPDKSRMEATLAAIRTTAEQCLHEGLEGGLMCCAAALGAWNDYPDDSDLVTIDPVTAVHDEASSQSQTSFQWTTGEPLIDRKSTFQAHVCRIERELDVKPALQSLLSSSKLQRATHNMVRWCRCRVSN